MVKFLNAQCQKDAASGRMTIIKRTNSNNSWGRCREREALIHCCRKSKLVHALWAVWKFLKTRNENLYDIMYGSLSYMPQVYTLQGHFHVHIYSFIIHNNQKIKGA